MLKPTRKPKLSFNTNYINATAEFISYSVYTNVITKEKTLSGAIVFDEFSVAPSQGKKERMNFVADGIEFKGAQFFDNGNRIKLSDIKAKQFYNIVFESVTEECKC